MHAVHKTVFINMSEDIDREDDLLFFFPQPYLIELEYSDDELKKMVRHGTLMNGGGDRHGREEIFE